MKKLVIIDHDSHEAYIETLTEEILTACGGDVRTFIKKNYNLKNYSWDCVTLIHYM